MTSSSMYRLESRLARTVERFRSLAHSENLLPAVDLDALPQVKLPWYEIRTGDDASHAAGRPAAATVFIFDEIGGSFGMSAKRFVEDLEALDVARINVRINSPGGQVFEAVTIHSALLHHPAIVRVYVDGIAASAASVIAMGADPYDEAEDTGGVFMMPGAQLMIHDASNTLEGNAEEHRQDGLFLDRQSDNVAGMYAGRGGGDPAAWRALMLAETWFFADEAVEVGLADRTRQLPERAPDELLTRTFDLSCYRYAGRVKAPTPPNRRTMRQPRVDGASTRRDGVVRTMPRRGADVLTAENEVWTSAARRRGEAGMRPGRQRGERGATMPASPARSLAFPAELTAKLETRRGQELYHLHGQASVFGRRYEMWDEFGPYWEKVNEHAADVTLSRDPDVAFLVNHRGVTMARTRAGTLELAASTGLDTDAWLNPKRHDVQDFVTAVEDKHVTEMSFAFMLDDGVWNQDFTEFEIMQFDLNRGDVSGVNYGANPYTSIDARQREMLADMERMSPAMGRAAMTRLMRRVDLDLDALYEAAFEPATDPTDRPGTAPEPVTVVTPVTRAVTGRSIAHIEAMLLDE